MFKSQRIRQATNPLDKVLAFMPVAYCVPGATVPGVNYSLGDR